MMEFVHDWVSCVLDTVTKYQTQGRFQTLRIGLKNRAVPCFFNELQGV